MRRVGVPKLKHVKIVPERSAGPCRRFPPRIPHRWDRFLSRNDTVRGTPCGGARAPDRNTETARFGTSWARRLVSTIRASRTPFARFLHSYQQRKGVPGRKTGGLFPCTPPVFECVRTKRPRSSRRAARWRRRRAAAVMTRLVFAANYMDRISVFN